MAKLQKPMNLSDPFAERIGPGLAPEGTFIATIEDILDEFQVERQKYQSEEREFVDLATFLFKYEDPQGGVHRVSSRRMKISGHPKSTLFGFLKSILGRAPQMGWDYLELKGVRCLLTVEHIPRRDGNGVFAGISSLSPVPSGLGAAGDGRSSFAKATADKSEMGDGGSVKPNIEHPTSNVERRSEEAGPSVEGQEIPY